VVRNVALGGTFEIVHKGHRTLLAKAFSYGGSVLIGLTSDNLANMSRSRRVAPYQTREWTLRSYLERAYPARDYEVRRIDDRFGPAVDLEDLQILVVSENTYATGVEINEIREGKGLPPLELVTIPHVLADDGEPISSTRVLAGECDADGHISS
jgi:pantetheine-phosphate adenylyltransferase